MTRLLSLTVADAPETWAALGFTVEGVSVRIGTTDIVCAGTATDGMRGVTDWMLTADDGPLPERIDGLLTGSVTRGDALPVAPVEGPRHVNGVVGIDHLVVMTPDLDRSVTAFEDLGFECRRRRQGAAYGSQAMEQAFFWLGNPDGPESGRVILEVVGPATVDPEKADGPAAFFGLALVVDDFDSTAAFFGDLMKPPSQAVQSGRQIATLSSRAGSTVAVALMSPHL
jgi:catechol 2,3-dioxygenase-like lactoylglutathione lyase family enzyme